MTRHDLPAGPLELSAREPVQLVELGRVSLAMAQLVCEREKGAAVEAKRQVARARGDTLEKRSRGAGQLVQARRAAILWEVRVVGHENNAKSSSRIAARSASLSRRRPSFVSRTTWK